MPEDKPIFDLPDSAKSSQENPKGWAVGVILAALITLLMGYGQLDLQRQVQRSSVYEASIKNPNLIYATFALGIIMIVGAIFCLVSKVYWPGYHFVFGAYLLFAGIFVILSFGGPMAIALAALFFLSGVWAMATGIGRSKRQKPAD